MYSSSDFERLFLRYKAEAVPQGESIQLFCSRNSVAYNLFQKWYKDTRHRVVPVQVDGCPVDMKPPQAIEDSSSEVGKEPRIEGLRILVDIRVNNGLHIQQRNLSYPALKRLIENLEVLC